MPIIHNGKEVAEIYYGSRPIGEVYYGTTLVWASDPYEPQTTIVSLVNNQSRSLTIPKGVYQLYMAGGGGNTASNYFGGYWWTTNGAGAGAWEGLIYFPKDITINCYASGGAGTSYLDVGGTRFITCNAGGTAVSSSPGGTVSVASVAGVEIVQTQVNATGSNGSTGSAGRSASTQGWGNANGGAGGFKLVYVRHRK